MDRIIKKRNSVTLSVARGSKIYKIYKILGIYNECEYVI